MTSRASAPAMLADWQQREIAVIGLARSGRSVATLLARNGSTVYASDAGRSPELDEAEEQLRREGVDVELGGHDLDRIGRVGLVVVSPGVPPGAPALRAAAVRGIEIVSEVEMALRFLPGLHYVAITGTNGKTTTTALIAHLLQALRHRAVAAGNIGTPLSEIALQPALPEWVALEVSSYQLHSTPGIKPAVGVLTNLSPNHLDRYTSVADYYGDKKLLFRNSDAASQWITNADDDAVESLAADAAGLHCRFSLRGQTDAYFDRESQMLVALGCKIVQREELALVGDHNVANALAAVLAVMLASPDHRAAGALERIRAGLRSFRGLEHRIEIVLEKDGVLWINDSKSTNVASTQIALRGMTRPTVLLLGGKHKGEPYSTLAPELQRTVKTVIAYGEAAPVIMRDLDGVVPVEQGGTVFADIVARARRVARPGDAILLSPACSSFDMFSDYEHRGREFKRLVTSA
ncbi:MAG TPA: UDP-N-acetylmuramoyl-L-alanine--D-glutamate ligase [Gemmatimonadaceae bacterium]|nr:UDP-N-acetylmuramoyl-L-alanine--D-glutamate ligase [Gemmatimonadaceae bacterium]